MSCDNQVQAKTKACWLNRLDQQSFSPRQLSTVMGRDRDWRYRHIADGFAAFFAKINYVRVAAADLYFWTPSAKIVNHLHLPSSKNPITTRRQKLSRSGTAIMEQPRSHPHSGTIAYLYWIVQHESALTYRTQRVCCTHSTMYNQILVSVLV